MWQYEKKLLRPVKIERSDPTSAKIIASQLGGPKGNKLSSFTQKKRGTDLFSPSFSSISIHVENDPPAAAPIKKFHSEF